ncbi:MAG: sulfatase-like hydrolase/transferase [Opitutaceae bacterium]|nr:sulfatase-like hydrolase/transferase [Opitutaceae bacterium]
MMEIDLPLARRRRITSGQLVAAIAALLVVGFFPRAHAAPAAARPNIVFVLTDDQRWNSLGVTGNPVVKTPHLDRLAAEGVLFEQGTITSAICTPSRACYFLGQYERRHGVNFNSGTAMKENAWSKSYPVLLRAAGYFTGYVGKNHVPVGEEGYASGTIERSFDFWYAGHNALGFYPKNRHPVFRSAKADTQIEIIAEGAANFLRPEQPFIAGAQSFLKSRPADRPFCLTVAFNVPHAAGTSSMEQRPSDPELYRTTYRDQLATQPIPRTYVAKADVRAPKLPPEVHHAQYRQKSYDYVDTEAALRERQIREYQTISGIDRLVGAIRAQLDKLGCADNTVILFSSDHGITHGEFGLGGKALNYDTCLRVPMIAFDPRAAKNLEAHRSAALVQSIDFAPTMLDLAGLPVPATMQGESFRPALEGRAFAGRRHAFAENLWSTYFGNPRIESVRTADWKYIRTFANDRSIFSRAAGEGEGGAINDELAATYAKWLTATIRGEKPVYEELYDLRADPDEAVNLAAAPAHAETLRALRAECQRLVTAAKGDVSQPPATVRLQNAREARGAKTKSR